MFELHGSDDQTSDKANTEAKAERALHQNV